MGLHLGLSLVAASQGYTLAVVCWLLIAVASLVVEHGLEGFWASVIAACGLYSCNMWAPLSNCGSRA